MQNAVNNFNAFFAELENHFVDRTTEIQQIKYALLTREHVLVLGGPGTGKSLLGRSIFHNIVDEKGLPVGTFSTQFSRFMSEDYVFGPINVKDLREHGILRHNVEGTAVTATFHFIDEFFDGNDPLLRSMLEILNERTFTRNSQQIDCPLHTAILTSNFNRDEESVQAIMDRILFKSRVHKLDKDTQRKQMYKSFLHRRGNVIEMRNKLPYTDILKLAEAVFTTVIPDTVLDYYDGLQKEFVKQTNKYISPRFANKTLNVIRANAVLNQRGECNPSDIEAVKYTFCGGTDTNDKTKKDEEEKTIFEAVFTKKIRDAIESQSEIDELQKLFGVRPIKHIKDQSKAKNLSVLERAKLCKKTISDIMEHTRESQRQTVKELASQWVEELKNEIYKCKSEAEQEKANTQTA